MANPDELWDQIDDATFNEWCALAIIDDWSGWQKVGTVCAATHNAILRVVAAQGGRVKTEDFRTPADYMPDHQKQRRLEPADESQFAGLKAALGL